MSDEKLGKDAFYEDVEVILNVPYNMPINQVLNSINFDIKVFKNNGDKPFIKVRYPKAKETPANKST